MRRQRVRVRLSRERRIAVACVLVAGAVSVGAVVAAIAPNGWSISLLVRMQRSQPIAELASRSDPGFRFVGHGAHYDGVYYYAIARDPLARGRAHRLVDEPAYRYGHPGYGWLAGLLSFGKASIVPGDLLVVNLVAMLVAAFVASLLAADLGWSPWGGLAVALNPGAIYAVTADTSEPLGLALLAFALLTWTRGRLSAATGTLVALCFVKEWFVLVPAGLAAWEAIEAARGRRRRRLGRRLPLLAAGPAALAAWYVYLRIHFDRPPFREAHGLLTYPFRGWYDSLRLSGKFGAFDYAYSQIGEAALPLLLVVGALLLAGCILAVRVRTSLDPVYLLLALAAFCFGSVALEFPKELIRNTAVLLALLPGVVAGASRRGRG